MALKAFLTFDCLHLEFPFPNELCWRCNSLLLIPDLHQKLVTAGFICNLLLVILEVWLI